MQSEKNIANNGQSHQANSTVNPVKAKRKKRGTFLSIYIDPGTSLSKVMYVKGRGQVQYLALDGTVLKLLSSSAASLPSSSGFGLSQDNAWIRFSEDGDCYLVGTLAKRHKASVSLNKLKYESIVPKILAIIGVIVTREKIKTEIKLILNLLLPFNEWSNREEIENELKTRLNLFYFQKQSLSVNLQRFSCFPEGYGMAMSYVHRFGLEKFQRCQLAYLMFGYRNTSLLIFRKGTLSKSESSTTYLGFYSLIDRICSSLSGVSRDEVQGSIQTVDVRQLNSNSSNRWAYISSSEFVIDYLLKSTDMKNKVKERKTVEKAIEVAKAEYWQLLLNWLDEALPVTIKLDEVIFCGGASDFLQLQLTNYFQEKFRRLRLNNSKIEQKQLIEALSLDSYQEDEFKTQNLALRFADLWGLFAQSVNYQQAVEKKASK